MKFTDYIFNFIASRGTKHVFGVTGGGVVHLFDSADHQPGLEPIYCHHEQAAALAAVAYSKIHHGLGVCVVTTGPAGTNALTGVLAAWQDSVPCLFLSGQARLDHVSHGKNLRQLGTQEFDIITTVQHMTKYAKMVENPEDIRYELEKAMHLAHQGRPGPVWLDLPLNFQWMDIPEKNLRSFDIPTVDNTLQKNQLNILKTALSKSERPLLLAGYGVHLAEAKKEFRNFISQFDIPWVSTWTAADLIETKHPRYAGRIGISGQRGANLAIQNCDLLISLGSQLLIPHTGTLFDQFTRQATLIKIDINSPENMAQTIKVDHHIQADLKDALTQMSSNLSKNDFGITTHWKAYIDRYKNLNTIPNNSSRPYSDPYEVLSEISQHFDEDDYIVIDGGGTALYVSFQAFSLKAEQRMICSSAISAMGTGLPEAIGVSFAGEKRRTICTIGDGSMQFNIQELQTITEHQLPIKIFIFNNNGYLAIRHTQDGFLDSNYTGTHPKHGLSIPNFEKIATAYEIPYSKLSTDNDLSSQIKKVLDNPLPQICEIMIDPKMKLSASQGFQENKDGTFSPRPLEDMAPYLSDDDFENLMFVPTMRKISS